MVARVVPQSARRRHAESRKPDLWGRAARPKAPVLRGARASWPCPACQLDKRRRVFRLWRLPPLATLATPINKPTSVELVPDRAPKFDL